MASNSATNNFLCLFLIILNLSIPSLALVYPVQWETGFVPFESLVGTTLHPFDVLEFQYSPGSGAVYLVDEKGYYSCDTSKATKLGDNGYTRFTLPRTGFFYFTSFPLQCFQGRRLKVFVKSVE